MFTVAMYNGQLIILTSVVQTLFDVQDAASDMLCAHYTLSKPPLLILILLSKHCPTTFFLLMSQTEESLTSLTVTAPPACCSPRAP